MPILAGILSTLFGAMFTLLAKRLAMNIAAAGSFLFIIAAAFAAAKLAFYALFAGLSLAMPASILVAVATFMPAHASQYVALILLAQSIMVAWDYWRLNLGIAYQIANS